MHANQLVQAYLTAMEARDLALAQSMLVPGFLMQFPGPVTFTSLAELIEWAKPRYRFVRKSYQRLDETHSGAAASANAIASGSATTPTVMPAIRSAENCSPVQPFKLLSK